MIVWYQEAACVYCEGVYRWWSVVHDGLRLVVYCHVPKRVDVACEVVVDILADIDFQSASVVHRMCSVVLIVLPWLLKWN